MNRLLATLLVAGFATLPLAARADAADPRDCLVGAYRAADGDAMALVKSVSDPKAVRFVLRGGRTGGVTPDGDGVMTGKVQTGGPQPVTATLRYGSCASPTVKFAIGPSTQKAWTRLRLSRIPARFQSGDATLAGQLIVPAGAASHRPVLVYTHGSEATAAIDSNPIALLLAADGVTGFVFDKRGTGASGGVYTQDFERLGEDAANAIGQARRMLGAKAGKVGVWGASQGGWIAPYAAAKAQADFVVVAYGVVGTPVEQDVWQVDYEIAHMKVDTTGAGPEVKRITEVTGRIAASNFRDHLGELDGLRADYGSRPWFGKIEGQYTGELLRGEIDRARSESPQVIWNYDSLAVMRRVKVPQLWIMAGEDSVAVSGPSIRRLERLQAAGKPIDIAVFPDTDHGIRTFLTEPDGKRTYTGYAKGYVPLTADWVKGAIGKTYGRARLRPATVCRTGRIPAATAGRPGRCG